MKSQQYYPYSTIYTLKITWTILMQKKTIWEKGTSVFHIVNFPFLDGDVPLIPSYSVYISQFIFPFARFDYLPLATDNALITLHSQLITLRLPSMHSLSHILHWHLITLRLPSTHS